MRVRAFISNSNPTSIRRGNITRYAISLILLVAIIGGFAWVAQNLTGTKPPTPRPIDDGTTTDKPALLFSRSVAQWYPPKAPAKPDEGTTPDEQFPPKDFEQGSDGYYDFLFKNVAETDIDIINYTTDCDCNSVQVFTMPLAEAERLAKLHGDKPGELLPYANEPNMIKLSREEPSEAALRVKVGEGGVVRVNFNAKKSPGQMLNVKPTVWYQPVGVKNKRGGQRFIVPVMVRQPVSFHPQRVSVGVLTEKGTADGMLIAWSSTRTDLKLELGSKTDPFFKIKTRPLEKEEFSAFQETLKGEKNNSTVRSAVQVTVTVNESTEDGKQLDLGSFYRKMPVYLDGILNTDVHGPEIVGRVEGYLMIGGADDQGRVRFKSFDAENGGKKIVQISADEKADLTTFNHQPSWVEVSLKEDKKNAAPPKRRIWILEARVPANTPAVRSFEEPDSIVLRVTTGKTERLVRIPMEGHIGGR